MRPVPTSGLLELLSPVQIAGTPPPVLTSVTQDSRLVQSGGLFVVRAGSKSTGFEFVPEAMARGAAMILTAEPPPASLPLPAIRVKNLRVALTLASHYINRDPSRNIDITGVTGTNGKTSTTHLTRSIYETAGDPCAMLTTIGYWTGREMKDAPLTTPDIDRICSLLGEAVGAGCKRAVMEVSSHALDQGRVDRMMFKVVGFTNLSQDHLDYHDGMTAYFEAKQRLFRKIPVDGTAVVNISQSWGGKLCRAVWGNLITVGLEGSGADLTVANLEHTAFGAQYRLNWQGEEFDVKTPLVGIYQGENIALAAGMGIASGFDLASVKMGLEALKAVPGRMEAVNEGQPFAIFADYSHTPDALRRALASLRPVAKSRLIALFGAGGDRDRTKRPLMGRIVAEDADLVFITSDNPRTEDPAAICGEIAAGVPGALSEKVRVIVDRRDATFAAVREARPGDVVLMAGKGSETYLEVHGKRTPYDDRVVAREVLAELGYPKEEIA